MAKSIKEHREEVNQLLKKLEETRIPPNTKVLGLGFEYRWFIGASIFCYMVLAIIVTINATNIPFSNWMVACIAFGIGSVAIKSGWGFYRNLRDYDKKYTKAAVTADINFQVAMKMSKFINNEGMARKYEEFLAKELN